MKSRKINNKTKTICKLLKLKIRENNFRRRFKRGRKVS